jgi:hypothetical protein
MGIDLLNDIIGDPSINHPSRNPVELQDLVEIDTSTPVPSSYAQELLWNELAVPPFADFGGFSINNVWLSSTNS